MRRYSLQKSIFVFYSILMIVLSLAILGVSHNVYNDILIRKIAQSRVDVLKQVAERTALVKNTMMHVSNTFCTNDAITDCMQRDSLTPDARRSFEEIADGLLAQTNAVFRSSEFEFTVTVLADNGLNYSTFPREEDYSFARLKDELWYKEVLNNIDGLNWVSSVRSEGGQRTGTVSAVRLITNGAGEIKGAVLINTREEFLLATYENMLTGDNDIFVVDENGKIVSNRNEGMLGLKYFNMERLRGMLNDWGFATVKNTGGRQLLACHDSAQLGWMIIEIIRTENIYAEVTKVTYMVCLAMVIAVGLAVLLSWYFAKNTVAPLRAFEKDIKQVQQGDMNVISTVQGWQEMSEIRDAFNDMIGEIHRLMTDIKREEEEKHWLEQEFLQAQINPHFLYNTLFSIKCLIGINENREAENMLSDFIALLRMVLNKEGNFIPVEKELEYTGKYVNILKHRYGEKFEFYIECGEVCRRAVIPKLILQPIVENAVFHGIESKAGSGVVVISVSRDGDDLVIAVSDDGIGMSQRKIEEVLEGKQAWTHREFSMVGIYNIQQRIQLYYGAQYGVTITSEENCGTTVTLRIPFATGGEDDDAGIDR